MLLLGERSLVAELPQILGIYEGWHFNESIFDICVIDVYLTSTPSSTWVLDTGSVANIGKSKQKLWN